MVSKFGFKLLHIFGIVCILFTFAVIFEAGYSKFNTKNATFPFETASPGTLAVGTKRSEGELTETISKLSTILITDYLKWHSGIVSNVTRGDKKGKNVRTLIYRGNNWGHGLGDRFRGLLHAYLCALFSDHLLLIDWNYPFPLSTVFRDGPETNFTYDPAIFGPELRKDSKPDQIVVRKSKLSELEVVLKSRNTIFFETEPMPDLETVFKLPDLYPDLPVSRKLKAVMPMKVYPEPFEFFPLLLKALFRPSPEFHKIIHQTLAAQERFSLSKLWRKGPPQQINIQQPYVSIHARLGHGVGEQENRFDLSRKGFTMRSTAAYMAKRAMKLAKKREISNPPRFYLATDTVKFRLLLKKELLKLDTTTIFMYGTWDVRHVKDLKGWVKDDLKDYMYTFMDLFVLSRGDSILYIRSGFATLAIWMGGIRSHRLFDFKSC